ncbi:hypothetical protein CLIB1444_20S01002 [[Candida] jaroonii]|uniref:Uncharacterized protein n=1 Tax=[Candida] jaroonii TaxID=467808 RepID=A0ACA9YFC5_9ASCO|nr:hypothetical protein CLIB1444_20S01002 [[Candida] jaroonii]
MTFINTITSKLKNKAVLWYTVIILGSVAYTFYLIDTVPDIEELEKKNKDAKTKKPKESKKHNDDPLTKNNP